MSDAHLLVLAVFTPLVGAILVALTGKWINLRESVSLAAGVTLLALVSSLIPAILAGKQPGILLALPHQAPDFPSESVLRRQ